MLWALRDLNPRHPACKAGALPTELNAHKYTLYFYNFWEVIKEWSGREDSNLRPLVPKTSALTGLRYAPNSLPTSEYQVDASN